MKAAIKGVALAAAFFCACGAVPWTRPASAASPEAAPSARAAAGDEDGYRTYRQRGTYPAAQEPLLAAADAFAAERSEAVSPQPDPQYGTVYRLDRGSTAAFTVTVPADAVYTAALVFACLDATAETYAFSLQIDGAYPFSACEELRVNALWKDDGGVRELSNGDQVNPIQTHVEGFVSRPLTDEAGIALSPYAFQLARGTHTVTIRATGAAFLLAGIRLAPPEQIRSYAEVSAAYDGVPAYTGPQIVVEAEDPEAILYKSAYALTAKADTGCADITPRSPQASLINYIGGSTWSQPGEEIAWTVTVPQDGLYKLGFSYKQNFANNGLVYRWLKVDGETPFAEAAAIGFAYRTGWQFQSFADEEGRDYLLYLTKGTHTLSLAVTLADIAEVFDRLSAIVEPLGGTYLDMVMITGDAPDANRDYELHKQIPGFVDTLSATRERIWALSEEIGGTLQVNGELGGALRNMARILDSMLGSLYSAHLYIPTYYTAYQTLSAWLYDIKTMSLSLDQLILCAPDQAYVTPAAGFWERLGFSIQRFFHSFSRRSDSVESSADDTLTTLKLWVNWGRDQVKVLNTLIQDSFTPQHGVNVKVEQVNASLVQGVISGNSPDVYLHLARTEPVNLAMRGVLVDLQRFEDYDEVLKNFQPGADIPYQYNGGCYALPDTQAFYVMFYRADILGQLGIAVPKTWDEFLTATGILQRNNMNAYLPYSRITAATTVNTGAGGLSIFPTMLLQRGGRVYTDAGTATALASPESVKAFTFWTEFYTKYGLDQDANFYQKFRVGTMPLGITTYAQYLTFEVTAPEIKGKWRIAEIPGEMVDGERHNVCSGAGTGCAIMRSSRNQDAAWEFLKWWVGADTQYRYSAENEAILGQTGRVTSSNVEAVSRLSWDSGALDVLLSQWGKVTEIPEVPGSYFVSRSIDQAFWATKNGTYSAREAIVDWSQICDKEIARKIREYAHKNHGE